MKRKKLHNQLEDMKGKIRVFARVRPMSEKEMKTGCQNITSLKDEMTLDIESRNGTKTFTFDACFGPDGSQVQILI